jgi:hypothetical protein
MGRINGRARLLPSRTTHARQEPRPPIRTMIALEMGQLSGFLYEVAQPSHHQRLSPMAGIFILTIADTS